MASWAEMEAEAPEFAAQVRDYFTRRTHHTFATLRADGSPRISGSEIILARGELWIGSMPQARKALDLLRDPRFALHCGSEDPPGWTGDAKVAGRFYEETDPALKDEVIGDHAPPGPNHLFRADLDEAVTTRLNDARDDLVIELWRPGAGVRRVRG